MIFLLLLQLWTGVQEPGALVAGHWQSCYHGEDSPIGESPWGEMAPYDRIEGDVQKWTFHMGPYDSFALFAEYEPEGDDHDSPLNLLSGHHALSLPVLNGRRSWLIDEPGRKSGKLYISVVQGGGSRDNCLAFYVLVRRQGGR